MSSLGDNLFPVILPTTLITFLFPLARQVDVPWENEIFNASVNDQRGHHLALLLFILLWFLLPSARLPHSLEIVFKVHHKH